jgi:hypothetical protein
MARQVEEDLFFEREKLWVLAWVQEGLPLGPLQ